MRVPSAHPAHTVAAASNVARLGGRRSARPARREGGFGRTDRRFANRVGRPAAGARSRPGTSAEWGSAEWGRWAGPSPLPGARAASPAVRSASIWPASALAVGTRPPAAACATAARRSRSRGSSLLRPARGLFPSSRCSVASTVSPIATTSASCPPAMSISSSRPGTASPPDPSGSRSPSPPTAPLGPLVRSAGAPGAAAVRRAAEKPQRSGRRSASITTWPGRIAPWTTPRSCRWRTVPARSSMALRSSSRRCGCHVARVSRPA